MGKLEILLPAMGEGIIEANIIKWLISEGDKVEEDDSIVEIATDKVDSEIPSPANGIIEKILFKEGDIPKVGEVLAILKTEGEDVIHTETNIVTEELTIETQIEVKEEKLTEDINKLPEINELDKTSEANVQTNSIAEHGFLSPLVKSILQKENISESELSTILGTGKDDRITKDDILAYVENRKSVIIDKKVPQNGGNQSSKITAPQVTVNQNDEIVEMDRMGKLIADYMVNSKQTSAHVTSFHEVDVTKIVNWRNKVKDEFYEREKEKLTFTPIFFQAVSTILKELPMVNVSVDGHKIIVRKNINIGMATALPNGNLIVPVIKNADQMNLLGITRKVNDLANRARNNKLQPDEIQGGTFTVTNLGTFGNLSGTPIINQPEVAILALGAIIKKPAVIETDNGDAIGIRHKMILSLSYDHRVVNGALGGVFLKKMADYLEKFDGSKAL